MVEEPHEFTERSVFDGYGWACTSCGCYVGPSDGCRCDSDDDGPEYDDDDDDDPTAQWANEAG